MRRAAPLLVATVVYLAACRLMLAPICNFSALQSATYEGDARLVVWALGWDNHAVLSRRPLFDANIFYPTPEPLAYGEHFFGISLFTLPVYALTHNPVLAYNVVWLLSYLFAAASAHYLAWRLTRDHFAAAAAGLTFAFCFFRMHHGHGHLHLLWVFWIPLSLVAMEKWLAGQTWKWLWLFVAIAVLQALSSWYQAVLIFVAAGLFMVWTVALEPLIERRWPWSAPQLARIFAQAVAGATVALAAIWPFARHYRLLTSGGPLEAAANSADVAAYLVPPQNTFIGRWLVQQGVHGPRWIWGELTLYVGWITLGLACIGAAAAVQGRSSQMRQLRYYVLLGVLAVALSAGPSAREISENAWHWSAFGLLARLPGIDLFRAPARFAALLTLALAVLASAGCAWLCARFGRSGRLLTAVALVFALAEFYVVDFPAGQPRPLAVPPVYRLIAALPPGPVVSLPDYAATPAWFREPDYQFFSTAHWRPIVNGYSRAEPKEYRERMQRLMTFPDQAALGRMRDIGLRYVIVHASEYPGGVGAVERARRDTLLQLLAQFDSDYLFEIQR